MVVYRLVPVYHVCSCNSIILTIILTSVAKLHDNYKVTQIATCVSYVCVMT